LAPKASHEVRRSTIAFASTATARRTSQARCLPPCFIDWNGINFNGRHEIHPKVVGLVEFANPIGPGWANPETGTFDDPRFKGRDGRPYGPLPRSWAHYQGQYRHGDLVILAYTVGKTNVLEKPSVETGNSSYVFSRTFNLGPRDKDMVLQVARGPKAPMRTFASGDRAERAVAFLGRERGSDSRNVMSTNENDSKLFACWKPDETRGDTVRDEMRRGLDAKVVGKGWEPAENVGILAGVSPP